MAGPLPVFLTLMEKQHLTYFKIENFKRFDSFEMSNLGQFNLIVGDNNVGKTSVLEGLCFDEDLEQLMLNFLATAGHRRLFPIKQSQSFESKFVKTTDFWKQIFKIINNPIACTTTFNGQEFQYLLTITTFQDLDDEGKEQVKKINPPTYSLDWITLINTITGSSRVEGAYFETFNTNVFHKNSPFIPVNLGYNQDLIDFFFERVNADKEIRKSIEKELRKFIFNLEELKVHRINNIDLLGITLTDSNDIQPITRYGDGTVKLIRFLLEVLLVQNRRLMVDEIGSGIHFTRLKGYWKTVLQLCAKYNVQLFATTHSLECQQAFVEALEDPDMQQYQNDARNISLIENKAGEVKAITYDFGQFEYALNIGFNTRGGAR